MITKEGYEPKIDERWFVVLPYENTITTVIVNDVSYKTIELQDINKCYSVRYKIRDIEFLEHSLNTSNILKKPTPKKGDIWYVKLQNDLHLRRIEIERITPVVIAIKFLEQISDLNGSIQYKYKLNDIELVELEYTQPWK